MCGINGIFKYNSIAEEDVAKLNAMNSEMRYRGPDHSEVWTNEKMGLAMVRLAIIGVCNGNQPIFNEDKSLAIVCNGEIYNYKELRDELKSKGHIFTTESDSEVILHLFEEKNTDCLENLRGMFAFAICDIKEQKIFIARDRAGKKPLYYSEIPSGIVFSSELKAIQKHYLTDEQIDYSVIRHVLRFSYPIELENTHIKQIKRVEPGEYAIISDNGIRKQRYWKKTNTYSFDGSFEEAKTKTLELLKESVRLRLRSDVPIAVLLSGGIDSSAIAALARETNDNIHAITVGYKGNYKCDEREVAKKFAKEQGLIWHELELDVKDFKNYFDEYISYIDEPVCDVAAIAQWGIYKKAKELGFTVLLTGNGGDELFYGYGPHNETGDNIELIKKFKQIILTKKPFEPYKWIQFYRKNSNDINKFLKTYTPYYFDRNFIQQYNSFSYNWTDKLDIRREANIEDYILSESQAIDGVYSYLFNVWLQANCFYLSDRLGMGHSLELRAPFADNALIDFVSSLPLEYRYKKDNPKWFLKEVLTGIVPDSILFADKRGFTPPYDNINEIINSYESKFFKIKLNSYNEVLIDKFLEVNTDDF